MPTVSVILPVYNGEEWIKDCISSITSQSVEDIEIIIVDDNSKDGSVDKIQDMNDSRIKLIRHDTNRGVPGARNTGIESARGDYICFIDQDDRWVEEKLEKQLQVFKDGDDRLGVVYGDVIIMDENTTLKQRLSTESVSESRLDRIKDIFLSNPPITITTMIKKKCFDLHGLLDDSLYGCDDYEFWLRIAGDFTFEYIPEPLAYKREHSKNTSGNINKMTEDRISIANEYINEYPQLRGVYKKRISDIYLIASYSHFIDRNMSESMKNIHRSIVADAYNVISSPARLIRMN
ncbi:glycosyltransferase [Halorubrum sp. Atlit-28R]|uniref:glycosyltransferase family 2 protein n=1 Tax=Halorubrum sp. Atlit-28R TaxID=2282129 RepID=UPI000EF1C402|nr:glycosyltransferase [Halorubrum sp. Atlit-28R]RLM50039.1 glycosyltransferase [Halorubrum sp. Atlit-28R]